ncbi:uncharacterized protein LOC118470384 isoform X1 [Amphiprion ocellaris]|uniref:uncharacterized protein LOC111587472 isoform X1 n=1 Tax=Amphiprion ocellaris TaxID=80972 RepID=UPI000C31483B|nr:uncharacterized protein LOC111587472 isoform X1 [Amphiprion ocellaris]XP_035804649.1 uncharacterized protein LOC118470384 isoform X1 [Amphiprion ocellaris]
MSLQEHSGGLTEAAALLSNILATSETIRTLSNATTGGQQSHAASGTNTVESQLTTLFPSRGRIGAPQPSVGPLRTSVPRYQAQQSFSTWTSSTRRRRVRAHQHDDFNKDVILLPNPSWGIVCQQDTKVWLHKHGHILSAFEFQKVWDHQTVIQHIRGGFGECIPEDDRFREGLRTLGVLEKIQKHPDSFRPLFCYEPSTLTADQLDDLVAIRLSPEGSNKRVVEDVVIPCLLNSCQINIMQTKKM